MSEPSNDAENDPMARVLEDYPGPAFQLDFPTHYANGRNKTEGKFTISVRACLIISRTYYNNVSEPLRVESKGRSLVAE